MNSTISGEGEDMHEDRAATARRLGSYPGRSHGPAILAALANTPQELPPIGPRAREVHV